MESDKEMLEEIKEKYSNETISDFDKIDYYNIKERYNDIGQSTEGLSQKQISRMVRKYYKSIEAYVELSMGMDIETIKIAYI